MATACLVASKWWVMVAISQALCWNHLQSLWFCNGHDSIMSWKHWIVFYLLSRIVSILTFLPGLRSGSGHKFPLTKKLLAIDTCWKRKNHFPPAECHWVYQPHFRAGPVVSISWLTQTSPFLCVLLLRFLSCLFVLILWEKTRYAHIYTERRRDGGWKGGRAGGKRESRKEKKERKEHEVVWVRIWRGLGMGWGRGNNIIKR